MSIESRHNRRHDADWYTGDRGRCDVHRIERTVLLGIAKLHRVRLRTFFGQGLLGCGVCYGPGEILPCLWTDRLRQWDDASDVRCALRVDIARIPLWYRRIRLLGHAAVRTRGESAQTESEDKKTKSHQYLPNRTLTLSRNLLLHGMQWLMHSSGVRQALSRTRLTGLA